MVEYLKLLNDILVENNFRDSTFQIAITPRIMVPIIKRESRMFGPADERCPATNDILIAITVVSKKMDNDSN